jgi:predicted RNA-binding protein with PIN domain
VPPPVALRPYVGFAKQTPQSLRAIARVVERDDEFRARVASAVEESDVGRAGWLWLTRPDGWQGELEELESASAARSAGVAEEREERAATRRLASAQAAAQRAEAEAAARLADLEGLRAELGAERARREAADARAAALEAEVASLTTARVEAVRNLKAVEARLVDRSTELNALRARARALEAEARGSGPASAGRPDGPAVPAGEEETSPEPPPPAPAPDPGTDPVPDPDRDAIARELGRAAAGAAAVARGLGALARLLAGEPVPGDPVPGDPVPGEPGAASGSPGAGEAATADGEPAALSPAGGRRVPLALPGGVFDDSVEAAEHLLRTPGVVLIVDGYNVSMTGWPELGAADQRRRLVAALHDLAARTATRAEVVFDGAEVDAVTMPAPRRRLVRVRFSPPGVEADDVVIDLVERLPAATPLVVASSDKRVRDGARRLGANLVHASQLLELLARR